MKVGYPELQLAAECRLENSSFPASNVEDEHPKKLFKATASTAALLLSVSAGSSAAALYSCNATSCTVTVRNGTSAQWASGAQWATGHAWATHTGAQVTIYELDPSAVGSLWAEYTAVDNKHIVEFLLANSGGSNIEVGIARAFVPYVYKQPQYPISAGLEDYSIVKKLANGSTYYRNRDCVRTFGLKLMEDRDPDAWEFLYSVAQLIRQQPIFWRIVDNATDREWIVYAKFDGKLPDALLPDKRNSNININLIEVL